MLERDRRHCVCGHHVSEHGPASLACEAETPQPCDCRRWNACHVSLAGGGGGAALVVEAARKLHDDHEPRKRGDWAYELVDSDNLHALFAALDAAPERATPATPEGLVEALRKYGRHSDACRLNSFSVTPVECSCGFDAALRAHEGTA